MAQSGGIVFVFASIAGITVGVMLLVVTIIVIVYCCCIKKKKAAGQHVVTVNRQTQQLVDIPREQNMPQNATLERRTVNIQHITEPSAPPDDFSDDEFTDFNSELPPLYANVV